MLKRLLIITFLFLHLQANETNLSAVTYSFSGGRFGDNLVAYCHAKWVSYKYGVPLLYKQFPYSDQLCMHKNEKHYNSNFQKYSKNISIDKLKRLHINKDVGILYNVPYFPESHFQLTFPQYSFYFPINWEDQGFIKELRESIKPLNQLNYEINIPKNHISIAVHVRKGTGFDISSIAEFEFLSLHNPLSCPPDSYYIEQIKKLAEIFNNKSLYVYIFTDHTNPSDIIDAFKNEIDDENIIFDCRTTENAQHLNVLDDFFALTKFDCLIKPDSNYSLMASKIADFRIIISPWSSVFKNGEVYINEVKVEDKLGEYTHIPNETGKITKEFIQKYLPDNPVILDAGAYNGNDPIEMATMWPDATIHAFEPCPNTYEKLVKSTASFTNIHCYKLALSDKKGSQKLYVSSGEHEISSSLLQPKEHLRYYAYVNFNDQIDVQTTTIDKWTTENNISKIDMLWLDMQGMEFLALKASPDILKTVNVIFTRITSVELYQGVQLFPEFKRWLEMQGFKFIKEEWVNAIEGNALFVRI